MRVSSRWIQGIWLVAFAILAGNVVLASYNVNALIHNDLMVAQSRATKDDVSDLLADLVSAESGQRGYLITSNREYLEPYSRAIHDIPTRRVTLEREMADEPDQLTRLAELETLIDAKLAEMAETVAIHERDGAAAAQTAVRDDRGQQLMRRIRAFVAEIDAREDARLRERSELALAKYDAATGSNLVGGGLALGMVWLAYSLIRGELARRRQAEADARLTAAALASSQKATADALAQLDAFLDHAPVGIAFYDKNLRYRRVNRVLAASNGIAVSDHFGRTTREVLPDFPDELMRDYERVLETGRPLLNRLVSYQAGAANVGGGIVWEVNLFPVPDGAGGTLGLGAFAQDVTRREQAQDRLRESEDRFRTLADAVPLFVWTTRPDGYHEYYNSRWYDYTGSTPAECLGHGWADPLHPDDAVRSRATWRHSLATGEPYDIEYRFKEAKTGEYRWFLGRARPVRDPATGQIARWFGTCTDIEDQKRLEVAARQSERRYRSLTEAAPGLVFSFMADGNIDYLNGQFASFAGLARGGVDHADWTAVVHPDGRATAEAAIYQAVRNETGYEAEYRLRRVDGVYRWFQTRAVPVDGDGGPLRWHAIGIDIDDRVRLETELRDSEARLRTLADAMPQIVFTASPEGVTEYFNHRWYEFTGFPIGEPGGLERWGEALHPDDRERAAATWRAATEAGEPYQIEYRFREAATGEYRWHLGRAVPSHNGKGKIKRWYGTATDIDDAKRLAAKLAQSEARFRTLAETVPGFVWSATPDGKLDYTNSRVAEYSGQPGDAALGEGWADLVHPDDRDRAAEAWMASLQTGEQYQTEFRLKRSDGIYRWFVAQAAAVRSDYAVEHWYGITTDVDDFRNLQAEMTRSQARFVALAEAVPGFMYSATPEGKIDYINSRWEQYTGQPAEEIYGFGWEPYIHPDDRESLMAAWLSAMESAQPLQVDYRVRSRDGTYRWYLAQSLPTFDDQGGVERWYGTASDIDDLKTLTARVEVSAERFRLLTESIPQMVWNADAVGDVTYFNTRWRDYTGLTKAAAVREWWAQILHPDDAAAVESEWRDCVEGIPEPKTWEVRVRRAHDGVYRWFIASVVPLRRPDGSVDQWIGSLSDIEEQKREAARLEGLVANATQSLRQSNEVLRAEVAERQRAEQRERAAAVELRRSNSELEKFAYVASHDLQEPLRKIQTFGDRLSQRFSDAVGETGRDYINRMQSSATRMRVLINDLLSFSRVATRTDPFMPVDLNDAVRDVLSDLEIRINEAAGRVEVGQLPTVRGDATQLKQLFQNLIGNALKFMRSDVPPVVTVRSSPTAQLPPDCDPPVMADGIRIEVSDNGIGFEQVYADRIFDVFQRLHGRGTYEGTGIGLAICRKIVERHGGGIAARSEPNQGARFVFDLPDESVGNPTTPTPSLAATNGVDR